MCVSPNLHVDQRSKRCLVVLTSTLTTTDTVHTEEDDSSSKCYNSNDDDPTILPHDDLRSASFRESSGVTTHSRQPTRTIDTPSSDTVDVSNVEVAGEHGWAERWLSVFCLEQAELWLNIPTSHFPNWCLTMSTSSFTSASSIAGVLVEPLHNQRCHPRKLTSRLPSLLVGRTIVCGCHICRPSHKHVDWRFFLKRLRKTRQLETAQTDPPLSSPTSISVGSASTAEPPKHATRSIDARVPFGWTFQQTHNDRRRGRCCLRRREASFV